jgi:hypothetical protein
MSQGAPNRPLSVSCAIASLPVWSFLPHSVETGWNICNEAFDMTAPFATLNEFRAMLEAATGPDMASIAAAKARNEQLTKPPGALGRLEELAIWYASWRNTDRPRIENPQIIVFAGNHGIDVYTSNGTMQALEEKGILTNKYAASVIPRTGVEACGMLIRPFSTSHDSKESVGYLVKTPDGRSIAIATDTGFVTEDTMQALLGCDMVMLESNHDVAMLEAGPYPYFLKRRVLSGKGHLSNDTCADTAQTLLSNGTTRFVLGHLSKQNNFPKLAYQTTHAVFSQAGAQEGVDYMLSVAGGVDGPQVVKF